MNHKCTTCERCGSTNPDGQLFCKQCGFYLRAPAPPESGGQGGNDAQGPALRYPAGLEPERNSSLKKKLLAGFLIVVFAGAAAAFGAFLYRTISDWETGTVTTSITAALTTTTTSATPTTADANSTTSTTQPAPEGVELAVTETKASSFLEAGNDITYTPGNLIDGSLSTAWNEGAEGNGIGEWVQFFFDPKAKLELIEIANGYQKDDRRFEGNVRVRVLRMEYSDGESQLVELFDDQGYQRIEPAKKAVAWVRLTIVSVYPNATWDDAALTEVRFWGTQG